MEINILLTLYKLYKLKKMAVKIVYYDRGYISSHGRVY